MARWFLVALQRLINLAAFFLHLLAMTAALRLPLSGRIGTTNTHPKSWLAQMQPPLTPFTISKLLLRL
jgi:hypothetical protein